MTLPPVCYRVEKEFTSPKWCAAFAAGCGGRISDARVLEDTGEDVAMFGSRDLWPVLTAAQQAGRTWFYGDHCYLGPVFSSYRITRNNYQVDGLSGRPDFRRLSALKVRARPWRRRGSHVLVCLQGEGQYKLFNTTLGAWLGATLEALTAATDRQIRVRTRAAARSRPLAKDLVDCWAVVVWSSNAAVDSLVAGVPVFVTAPWAAAARMGLSDLSLIERPILPAHRERWLATLAANQWTLDEMRSGRAWSDLADEEAAA